MLKPKVKERLSVFLEVCPVLGPVRVLAEVLAVSVTNIFFAPSSQHCLLFLLLMISNCE